MEHAIALSAMLILQVQRAAGEYIFVFTFEASLRLFAMFDLSNQATLGLTQKPAVSPLTSVRVVEVDKLLPFVVRQQAEDRPPQGRPHLDDELYLIVGGVTGRDKWGVQSAAERGQGVHGLLVVESKDGVHPAGELRANCRDSRAQNTSITAAVSMYALSKMWATSVQAEML